MTEEIETGLSSHERPSDSHSIEGDSEPEVTQTSEESEKSVAADESGGYSVANTEDNSAIKIEEGAERNNTEREKRMDMLRKRMAEDHPAKRKEFSINQGSHGVFDSKERIRYGLNTQRKIKEYLFRKARRAGNAERDNFADGFEEFTEEKNANKRLATKKDLTVFEKCLLGKRQPNRQFKEFLKDEGSKIEEETGKKLSPTQVRKKLAEDYGGKRWITRMAGALKGEQDPTKKIRQERRDSMANRWKTESRTDPRPGNRFHL